jgi:hypothetical protein
MGYGEARRYSRVNLFDAALRATEKALSLARVPFAQLTDHLFFIACVVR